MARYPLLRYLSILVVFALAVGLLSSAPSATAAATFTVNSTADEPDANPGDGVCASAPSGICTLRAAVMEANALPGGDTLQVPAGTYVLSRIEPAPPGSPPFNGSIDDTGLYGDLDILDSVVISGAGPGQTVVQIGNGLLFDRILDVVAPGIAVVLEGLTVTGGQTGPGTDQGAGIFNRGATLTLRNSTVSGNHASFRGGGGLANNGTATLTDVTMSGNSAQGPAGGGGIYNTGALTGTRVIVAGNGSGPRNKVECCGDGGGIANLGTMILTDAVVADNSSGGNAGGILNAGSLSLTLDRVTISGNSALQTFPSQSPSVGGGILNASGTALTVTNSTISGNTSDDSAAGLHNQGWANLLNVTVANNNAPGAGRSLVNAGGTLRLQNSLVYYSAGGNCAGPMTSLGNNLDNGDTCGFSATGDRSNVDPKLGPLADNGGFSKTHALLGGSAAIDAGSDAACPPVDQRGAPRPRDGNGDGNAVCDIGAFEAQTPLSPPPPPPPPPPGGLVVTTTQDLADAQPGDSVCAAANGACTLRAAIMEANARAGADTISLPAGTYVLFLTGADDAALAGDLDVTSELRLSGAGAGSTTVVTETGEGIFEVRPGGRLTVESLRLQPGARAPLTALIVNLGNLSVVDTDLSGGPIGLENLGEAIVSRARLTGGQKGIKNGGSLTMTDLTIAGAGEVGLHHMSGSATLARSTVAESTDAGIVADAPLMVTDSTVSGNRGPGIIVSAGLSLMNVTVSGNATGPQRIYPLAGVYVAWHSGAPIAAYLTNITIAENAGPGVAVGGYGTAVLRNTILAANRHLGTLTNCYRGDPISQVTSDGYNLEDGNTCGLTAQGDHTNTGPMLGPLADNGGLTRTQALLPGSPAIDAGTNQGCPAADQRGVTRPQDGNGDGSSLCDIGAYEVQVTACTPRPADRVAVVPAGPNLVQATITAGRNGGTPNNTLRELRFGTATNASIDVEGRSGLTGNVTVPLAPGTTSVTFFVRRGPNEDSATVQLVVVDDCGTWPTLVGGGRDAWSGTTRESNSSLPGPPPTAVPPTALPPTAPPQTASPQTAPTNRGD
ncbi:MAG: right-handed parallel beta-helix repeat-containing protein [Chloroflexi bacterium]|nr:right-handed parallel beta-helix repeat-containing protein [Chloroflexota bacterium]